MSNILSDIYTTLTEFNWISVICRFLLAALLGGLIGGDREKYEKFAGLRTHILICVGAALTAMTALYVNQYYPSGDIFRIASQIISGIGFLGAGTILVKNKTTVTGLTTSAGLLATAAIGIAVGFGFYLGAIAASILCVIVISHLIKIEMVRMKSTNIYIETDSIADVQLILEIVQEFTAQGNPDIIPPKSGMTGHVGIITTVAPDKDPELLDASLKEACSIVIFSKELGL